MKLIVGNQKNYLTFEKAQEFVRNFKDVSNKNIVICPSYIYLDMFKKLNIQIGAQNVSKYEENIVTGDISIAQLKSMDINISIVGHSERRQLLNERISDTNKKVKELLSNNMVPILCVGETMEEKNAGKTKDVIFSSLKGAFKDIDKTLIKNVIVAYEPIWSIGTGNIPSSSEIDEIMKNIKEFLSINYSTNNLVLYGGSVNSNNIDILNEINSIDGYLIGGASTKMEEFTKIIDRCN